MQAQSDYEMDPVVAVFRSPGAADEAARKLAAEGVPRGAIAEQTLPPGRYQCEDRTLPTEARGATRGAVIGTLLGGGAGLVIAGVLTAGTVPIFAGLAAAGGAGGFLIGGFMGAITRTFFDDDEARWISIPPGASGTLLVVVAPSAPSREPGRVRQVLQHADAVFLDRSMPEVAQFVQQAQRPAGRVAA